MNEEQALGKARWDMEAGALHFIEKWRHDLHAATEIWVCDKALALLVDHEIEAAYREFRNELYLEAAGEWGLEYFNRSLELIAAWKPELRLIALEDLNID